MKFEASPTTGDSGQPNGQRDPNEDEPASEKAQQGVNRNRSDDGAIGE
jgi:hypothetical protein